MVLQHFVLGMNFLKHGAARTVTFKCIYTDDHLNLFPCAANAIHIPGTSFILPPWAASCFYRTSFDSCHSTRATSEGDCQIFLRYLWCLSLWPEQ